MRCRNAPWWQGDELTKHCGRATCEVAASRPHRERARVMSWQSMCSSLTPMQWVHSSSLSPHLTTFFFLRFTSDSRSIHFVYCFTCFWLKLLILAEEMRSYWTVQLISQQIHSHSSLRIHWCEHYYYFVLINQFDKLVFLSFLLEARKMWSLNKYSQYLRITYYYFKTEKGVFYVFDAE